MRCPIGWGGSGGRWHLVTAEGPAPQRRRQHGGARRATADAVDAASAIEQPTARYLLMDERLHSDVWARERGGRETVAEQAGT